MVPRTVIVALLAGALAAPSTRALGADESDATAQCADRDRVGYEPVSTRSVISDTSGAALRTSMSERGPLTAHSTTRRCFAFAGRGPQHGP
jgi:hypothetical protein